MQIICAFQNGDVKSRLSAGELRGLIAAPEEDLWIDIHDPSAEYVAVLADFLGLDSADLYDALAARVRPRVDIHNQCYVIEWYTASYDVSATAIPAEPLVLIVGARFLLTLHNQPVPQIEETRERWHETDSALECRAGVAVHALLDTIVDDYYPLLDDVADSIDDIEARIFQETRSDPIQHIFGLKKGLLHFRRIVAPERDVINTLLRRDLPVFLPEDMSDVQDLYNRLVRMTESIDLYRDLLSSGLDSYVSMQSNRLNEVIKVLTVASIILMTNALIAGIYGMNFEFMPELHWAYGYPLALTLMAGLTLALILFFRHRKWL